MNNKKNTLKNILLKNIFLKDGFLKNIFLENALLLIYILITAAAGLFFCAAAAAEHLPSPIQLEDIVITGEKIEDYIMKNPSQVAAMGIKEIKDRNFLGVGEALGSMPGVDVTQGSTGLGSRIAIRGGGGSGSVLVLIDGRPAATMRYGGVDLSSLPIDMIKKITVFKPPVPVWLGPGSSAGAIYIETRKGRLKKKMKKKGRIRLLTGAFGEASASATCQVDSGDHDLMISGGTGHKDGNRDNSQKNYGHLNLHYGKKADLTDVQVNTKFYVSEHESSGPTYNPTPNASQRYEKASLDMKVSGMAKDLIDYEIKAFLDVKALDDHSNTGTTAKLDAFTTGVGTDLFFTDENQNNEFRIGSLITHNKIEQTLTGSHERSVFSLNGVDNFKIALFRMTTGLRIDYADDFHFSPGAHLGISFEAAPKTIIKANAGYSENIPSFGQLYQSSHGSIDQVRGNPNLKKEEIVSLNLGLSHSFENKHQLDVSLFRTDAWDLIKYYRGNDLISRPENISRAVKQGIETSFKLNLTDNIGLDIGHVWQTSKNKSNDNKLSYTPEHTIKLTLKTKFKTGTRLELTLKNVTDQFTDTENNASQRLKEYITTDARIIHPINLLNCKTEIFVHLKNLFNEDFSSHYGYPDDGFRFQCGLNINF